MKNEKLEKLVGWLRIASNNPGQPYIGLVRRMTKKTLLDDIVPENMYDEEEEKYFILDDLFDDVKDCNLMKLPEKAANFLNAIGNVECHIPTKKEMIEIIREML